LDNEPHNILALEFSPNIAIHRCRIWTNILSIADGREKIFSSNYLNWLISDLSKCFSILVHEEQGHLYDQLLLCARNSLCAAIERDHSGTLDLHQAWIFIFMAPLVSSCTNPIDFQSTDTPPIYFSTKEVHTTMNLCKPWMSNDMISSCLETLHGMCAYKTGQQWLRQWAVYPILRAFHLDVGNEIAAWDELICDLVQCIFAE
jgi:hypothetical protein